MQKFNIKNGNMQDFTKYLETISDNNPRAVYDMSLDYLRAVTDGEVDIINNQTPFTSLLGLTCTKYSKMLDQLNTISDNTLLSARNMHELYPYLSVGMIKDLLATPVTVKFTFKLNTSTMLSAGINEYVIRKNSTVRDDKNAIEYVIPYDLYISYDVASRAFIVQYDNEWKYDTSTDHKIHIDRTVTEDGNEYIVFDLLLDQLAVSITDEGIVRGEYTKIIPYKDQITRVEVKWLGDEDSKETEVVYSLDSLPTDLSDIVSVEIDTEAEALNLNLTSFVENKTVDRDTLSVIVYTTKGKMYVDYSAYTQNDFSIIHLENTVGANINSIELNVTSEDITLGGSNMPTFSEIKSMLIRNRLSTGSSLTENNLFGMLERQGIYSRKVNNSITGRTYIGVDGGTTYKTTNNGVTELPYLFNIGIGNLEVDFDNLNEDDYIIHPGVIHFNKHSLFKITHLNNIRMASQEEKVIANEANVQPSAIGEFVYTPFYYMIYLKQNGSYVKAFDLDNPIIYKDRYIYTSAIDNNPTIEGVSITAVDKQGYKLTVETSKLPMDLYDVYVKFDKAVIKLTDVTNDVNDANRIMEGNLFTDKTVLATDEMVMTNVTRTDLKGSELSIPVSGRMSIVFTSKDKVIYSENRGLIRIDESRASSVVTEVEISYKLGTFLEYLWTGTRRNNTHPIYDIVEQDEPLLYPRNIYDHIDVDPNTCDIEYVITHKKGDPVLKEDGSPELLYRKGDKRLDPISGLPIVKGYSNTSLLIDVTVSDLAYKKFPIDDNIITASLAQIKERTTRLFSEINKDLTGNTDLYYCPRGQIGQIRCKISETDYVKILRQPINIKVYIPRHLKPSEETLSSIKETLIGRLFKALNGTEVNIPAINLDMIEGFSNIISSVSIDPLIDDNGDTHLVVIPEDISFKIAPVNSDKTVVTVEVIYI